MGHGLLKSILSPSHARAKGGGLGALRLLEMAKGDVIRITLRIDVYIDLKIEAALGQGTLVLSSAVMDGDMMIITPRLWGNTPVV